MSKLKRRSISEASSRREFAKRLASMAMMPLAARAASAQEPSPARPRPPQQTPPADAQLPESERLVEFVRIRYGKHLTEEQLESVRRSIDRGLRNADRLKQFKLNNGDEPAFAFSADL